MYPTNQILSTETTIVLKYYALFNEFPPKYPRNSKHFEQPLTKSVQNIVIGD